MSYCTDNDLVARFGEAEVIELTDQMGAGVMDASRLAAVIADADNQIDAKLRGRYSLPLNPIPAELTRIACDLARFYLHDDAAPDIVVKRYDAAMRELRDYASGASVLDTGAAATATSPQAVAVSAPPSVFDNATLARMP